MFCCVATACEVLARSLVCVIKGSAAGLAARSRDLVALLHDLRHRPCGMTSSRSLFCWEVAWKWKLLLLPEASAVRSFVWNKTIVYFLFDWSSAMLFKEILKYSNTAVVENTTSSWLYAYVLLLLSAPPVFCCVSVKLPSLQCHEVFNLCLVDGAMWTSNYANTDSKKC